MKATTKRLVGILLAMAMVLAMLPMAVFAAGTTTLYCAAPSNWTNCNVYWWGSSDTNPGWPGKAMTKGDDGIWYYEVPADATNVIFNNGSGQSPDLVMPADDKVQYNYEAKEWVTYGADVPVVETIYYLRGTMNGWDTSMPMTKQENGTYAITVDLAAGDYEYKAAIADWSWSCPGGGNLTLTLDADDTVTFTLDLNANSLTYTLASGTVVEVEYFLRGSMNEWSANDASKMVKQADGTYAITLSLAAGTYEYKAAIADWSWSVPGGDNAVLTLTEAADVTFVLDVAAGTLTNDAPIEEPAPEPTYEYYVAGSAALCNGIEWDPAAEENKMTWNDMYGGYAIYYQVMPGTYEFKITTGSWDTPSYGDGNGNMTLKINGHSLVVIVFNPETQEINCIVNEVASDYIKWQLNADASADDETVDLRFVTFVETLDYAKVEFYATINGVESEAMVATTVYESIVAGGTSLTCEDIFDTEGYLVTYTIENLPAEYYDAEILVEAVYYFIDGGNGSTGHRTIVVSDAF